MLAEETSGVSAGGYRDEAMHPHWALGEPAKGHSYTIQPRLPREKLEDMQLGLPVISWIEKYLTNRLQYVRLQKCVSDPVVRNNKLFYLKQEVKDHFCFCKEYL